MFSYLYLCLLLAAVVCALPGRKVTRAEIDSCLDSAAVPQYLSTSTNFTQAVLPYNLRIPFTPVAVAVPTTVAQVQAAVKCGAKLGITVSPKSGGHSYANHGIGGEDGHLMVDMKYWNTVSLDKDSGVATIGPGSRLGNVAQALYTQGNVALSHGTCPSVGVGGHVLHGGYGYSSHTYGLALDSLVSAEVVLADSTIVTASKTSNSDLFWALRGAGSSYGIVTSLKFQTHPAPENNTVFSYGFNFNQTRIRNAHAVLQDYANTTMPSQMNMRFMVNPYSVTIMGVYYGSQEDFKAAVAPVLAKLGNPSSTSIRTRGWIQSLSDYAYDSLTTAIDFYQHETFFAKSLMTVAVNDDALDAFWAYYTDVVKKKYNNRDWYMMIDLHGGPTSAISKVPVGDTSYAHRKALLKYQFMDHSHGGTYPQEGFTFLNGWVASITDTMKNTAYSPFGMYINYADTTLSPDEAHSHYWLTNYAKLKTIKDKLDPKSVFSNPQAISRK